jgi:hypothetical protein
MENQKVRESSLRLSTTATTTRQTPKTDFGSIMRNGLIRTGNVVLQGMQYAAPFVPGGAIITAALAGTTNAIAGGGVSGGYGASPDGIGIGGGGAAYGSSVSGLTGQTGGVGGSLAGGGGNQTLAIPGARPGLTTDLNQPASNFAGSFGGGVAGAGAGPSDAFNQMMHATKQMAEFQASFNLQYLQLQEKIQIDTRQFNLVSNIMKTKHDAAKNALNNVR